MPCPTPDPAAVLSELQAAWLIDGYHVAQRPDCTRVSFERGGQRVVIEARAIGYVRFYNALRRLLRQCPDPADRQRIQRLPRLLRAELRVL